MIDRIGFLRATLLAPLLALFRPCEAAADPGAIFIDVPDSEGFRQLGPDFGTTRIWDAEYSNAGIGGSPANDLWDRANAHLASLDLEPDTAFLSWCDEDGSCRISKTKSA